MHSSCAPLRTALRSVATSPFWAALSSASSSAWPMTCALTVVRLAGLVRGTCLCQKAVQPCASGGCGGTRTCLATFTAPLPASRFQHASTQADREPVLRPQGAVHDPAGRVCGLAATHRSGPTASQSLDAVACSSSRAHALCGGLRILYTPATPARSAGPGAQPRAGVPRVAGARNVPLGACACSSLYEPLAT